MLKPSNCFQLEKTTFQLLPTAFAARETVAFQLPSKTFQTLATGVWSNPPYPPTSWNGQLALEAPGLIQLVLRLRFCYRWRVAP
jgi:hypothetical protein